MVLDEESDIISSNSGSDKSVIISDSCVNNTCLEKTEKSFRNSSSMNFRNSSSMDTKIFYNNKRIKEESNLKSKSKSVYDMDSDSEPEGNENKNETDWQRYRYSSKSRFSDLVKSKRNSKGKSNFDSDEESTDGENSKILKVRYPKPKKYMIDLHDYTLKDIKEFKNSKKRKPFTPNNDSEDEEQKIIRTSSRKRNTVNYVDYRASDASSSEDESSNYEDSSEDGEANASEDENRNRIKKKVESPVIMFKKTPLSEYEQMVERNKEANRKMLEEMGLFQAKNDLEAKNNPQEPKKKYVYEKKLAEKDKPKRSQRVKKLRRSRK